MAVNPTHLARAIVSWLEFEALAGREDLLDEGYLATPIAQYLKAAGHGVMLERVHPRLKGNNRIDFATRQTKTSSRVKDAIETKLVNGKRKVVQEVFDDLARLESLNLAQASGDRLLVIAGTERHLRGKHLFSAIGKRGKLKLYAMRGVLRQSGVGQSRTVEIRRSKRPQRTYWLAAQSAGLGDMPGKMRVKLVAKLPANPKPADYVCYVWEVFRLNNQSRKVLTP
jgi:hypothetical protein